jgi:ATP-dependent Clp protease adaptor protein ClpS
MAKEQSEKSGNQTAVLPAKAQPKKKQKPSQLPPYHVILLDDNDHSFEYVIEMLKVIFAYPEEKGFKMAEEVHLQGRCIVLTTHKEKAELKRDQIHSYGADQTVATSKGSMSAIIQAAEG